MRAAVQELELTELIKKARPLQLICLTALLTACQNVPRAEPTHSAPPSERQAFARTSCGGCHAVGREGTSPNPNAPTFMVIVNQEGVTAETLSDWLRGAHNYPREMDFYLGEAEVTKLVSYMITLKDPNFRRPPD